MIFNLQGTNLNIGTTRNTSNTITGNFVKRKPQTFYGYDEEFEDFLTKFEINAENNGGNYRSALQHVTVSFVTVIVAVTSSWNNLLSEMSLIILHDVVHAHLEECLKKNSTSHVLMS